MSLTIIKAGVLDTIQDFGRFGRQAAGINPGGAMDRFSAGLANCLLGKEMNSPVIEMHFPASAIRFNRPTIICITGADFTPMIAERRIPLHQPLVVKREALLEFKNVKRGARCYLSILHDLLVNKWLGSYSTNLKAEAGGFEGRALKKGDVISFEENAALEDFLAERNIVALPWKAAPMLEETTGKLEFIEGPEWDWLTTESQGLLSEGSFTISNVADRMGYRLEGPRLHLLEETQLVSSGVTFGTVQLLPNGQLITLMADHQTTGGYPRIANIISAHLPALAQMKTNEKINFRITDITTAQQNLLQQHQYLQSVQSASQFKMQNLLQT